MSLIKQQQEHNSVSLSLSSTRVLRKIPASTPTLALLFVAIVLGTCRQASAFVPSNAFVFVPSRQRLLSSPSSRSSKRMSSTAAPHGHDLSQPPSTTPSSSSYQKQKSVTTSASPEKGDAVDFDWRAIATNVFGSGDKRSVVLFDGVCNLCNGAVNFSLDHDPKGTS